MSIDSQVEMEHLKTEYDEDGIALEYYMTELPDIPTTSIHPLPSLIEEKSSYEALTKLLKGMKGSFERPYIKPSYSPFQNIIDDIIAMPIIREGKKQCKRNEERLDEMITFLYENRDEIQVDSDLWSATEDWVLSYLEDVSRSYARTPSSYACEALRSYRRSKLM